MSRLTVAEIQKIRPAEPKSIAEYPNLRVATIFKGTDKEQNVVMNRAMRRANGETGYGDRKSVV